jgi:ribosomal protein S18 acetylase RimI-like enzyme
MAQLNNHVVVRAATIADVDAIVAFNAAMAIETESKTLPPEILRAGVDAVFADPRRGFYRIAEVGGIVAGCLMITFEWSDWRNGDWWWLQSVYVKPEFRRRGAFSALYGDIERAAQSTPGVVGVRLYVEKENRHAQNTYASLGMHEADYLMYAKNFDPRIAQSR